MVALAGTVPGGISWSANRTQARRDLHEQLTKLDDEVVRKELGERSALVFEERSQEVREPLVERLTEARLRNRPGQPPP